MKVPVKWWWLSFADETGFLGVCVVQAHGFIEAVLVTKMLGINPGGEVRGIDVRNPDARQVEALNTYRDRLLTRAEVQDLDRAGGGDGELVRMP